MISPASVTSVYSASSRGVKTRNGKSLCGIFILCATGRLQKRSEEDEVEYRRNDLERDGSYTKGRSVGSRITRNQKDMKEDEGEASGINYTQRR